MAVAVGAFLAVAASNAQPVDTTPVAAAVEVAAPEPARISEGAFVAVMRGLLGDGPGSEQTDADLINGGRSICAEVSDGATWQTFSRQIEEVGGDFTFYRAAIRASVEAFCPASVGDVF